jgi:hypothetical protein
LREASASATAVRISATENGLLITSWAMALRPEARSHRHLDVGQHQVEGAVRAAQDLERFGAIRSGGGVVAVHRDRARDQKAHRFFIVDNQHA